MKSPRTTLQREWLIRIAWRCEIDWIEVPIRTLRALDRAGWVVVLHCGTVKLADAGSAWVQAFKDGTKSIGGVR